jgi:DNA-directed RNA polymerase subunit alpha
MTEAEIGAISNFGQKSLEEVHALLESLGLALGMKIEGWPPAQLERPEAQEA